MVKGKGHGRIDTRWEEVPGVVFEFLLKALGELFLDAIRFLGDACVQEFVPWVREIL